MARVCLVTGCPELVTSLGRCADHAAERETRLRRTVPTKRTRSRSEQRRRAQAVADYQARHGDWCPGYGRNPHPAADLTADHITAVAAGGAPDGPHAVLCRSCNGRKSART